VTIDTIVPRATTVIVSAAPATASASSVSQSECAIAKTANAAPQIVAPTSIAAPCRVTCLSGPERTAVTMPPTPTAAVNSPSVRGSPPDRSALSAGNSEVGSPKNVAQTSVRNAPVSTGVRLMNEKPAETEERRVRSE
jgi:hypothetical protein